MLSGSSVVFISKVSSDFIGDSFDGDDRVAATCSELLNDSGSLRNPSALAFFE